MLYVTGSNLKIDYFRTGNCLEIESMNKKMCTMKSMKFHRRLTNILSIVHINLMCQGMYGFFTHNILHLTVHSHNRDSLQNKKNRAIKSQKPK